MRIRKERFIVLIDYQVIVNLCGEMISNALPIGLTFAISERLVNAFISIVTGERRIKL